MRGTRHDLLVRRRRLFRRSTYLRLGASAQHGRARARVPARTEPHGNAAGHAVAPTSRAATTVDRETRREHRPTDDAHPGGADARQRRLRRRADQAVTDLTGYIVAGVIALLATAYLVVAMLFPEKF